jgi:hypothetical protein
VLISDNLQNTWLPAQVARGEVDGHIPIHASC